MKTAAKYGSTPRTWRSIYKYIATEKHALIKYSLDANGSPGQCEARGRGKEGKGPREMKIGGFCYFIWGGKRDWMGKDLLLNERTGISKLNVRIEFDLERNGLMFWHE